jgi:hypothetical protein
MHAAAYHHYALDYGLAAAILLVLFAVLVLVAVLDGQRQRRRHTGRRANEQHML